MQGKMRFAKKGEGMLEEETMKMVIAAICILALLYLGYLIYGIFNDNNERIQARAGLENIGLFERGLYAGEIKTYLIESPKNWYLTSISKLVKPECTGNSCLCMCNEKDCSDKYTCIPLKFKEILFDTKSSLSYYLGQDYSVKESITSAPNYISLEKAPIEIKLSRKGESLLVELTK